MDETDHIYRPYGLTTNDAINIPKDLVGVVEGEINRVDVHIGYIDESYNYETSPTSPLQLCPTPKSLTEFMQKINGSSIVVVEVEATSPMPTQLNVVAPLPT
jgi:hypothetical protein